MFPEFENQFLESLVFSLKKRRKSLAHKNVTIRCDKVYETTEGLRTEIAEVVLDDSIAPNRSAALRLNVWPNRWVWVDARKYEKKGLAWSWSFEGRLQGNCSARDLVETAEESFLFSRYADPSPTISEINKYWHAILATGPKLVGG